MIVVSEIQAGAVIPRRFDLLIHFSDGLMFADVMQMVWGEHFMDDGTMEAHHGEHLARLTANIPDDPLLDSAVDYWAQLDEDPDRDEVRHLPASLREIAELARQAALAKQ